MIRRGLFDPNLNDMYSYYQNNKAFLHLIGLILIFPLIFWTDTQNFIKSWAGNAAYSHGYFILPISLWLLYRQRHAIKNIQTTSEPRALVLLAAALLLWFLSYISGVNVTQQLALVTLIPISIWILFGRNMLKTTIFPVTFLFFMIPVGGGLIPPLMEITADITVSLVDFSGIPVYRDGLYFTLPTGNWSVVEACSGLNYLVASLTLGLLFSYLAYRSFSKRALFILAIALLSIVANGLRAYGIVVIGHLTNMEYGAGGDHEFYGWLFYGFFVFWIFYLGNFWADKPVFVQANSTEGNKEMPQGTAPIGFFIVIFLATITVQVLATKTTDFYGSSLGGTQIELPENYGAWHSSPTVELGWKPQITGASIVKTQRYNYGGDTIQISLGYYPWQSQGAEAVGWGNRIEDSETNTWKISAEQILNYEEFSVIETEIYQQKRKLLVWNWYLVGTRATPDPKLAKLFNILNIVLYQRNDAAFLTLATPISQDRLASRENLEAFYNISHRDLHRNLSSVILEIKSFE